VPLCNEIHVADVDKVAMATDSSEDLMFQLSTGPSVTMVALCNRADHYIFILFHLLLFSSPNLSSRRLDVYQTSAHGEVVG